MSRKCRTGEDGWVYPKDANKDAISMAVSGLDWNRVGHFSLSFF